MTTNYISTVQHSTAISDADCGYFYHRSHPNLILAKSNNLEFYSVLTNAKTQTIDLQLDKKFQIFGDIAAIHLIYLNSRKQPTRPLLFLITRKQNVAFIEPASKGFPTLTPYCEPKRSSATTRRSSAVSALSHESSDAAGGGQFRFKTDLRLVLRSTPHAFEMNVVEDATCESFDECRRRERRRSFRFMSPPEPGPRKLVGRSSSWCTDKMSADDPGHKGNNFSQNDSKSCSSRNQRHSERQLSMQMLSRIYRMRPDLKQLIDKYVGSRTSRDVHFVRCAGITDDQILYYLNSCSPYEAIPDLGPDNRPALKSYNQEIKFNRQFAHASISFHLKTMPIRSLHLSKAAFDSISSSNEAFRHTPSSRMQNPLDVSSNPPSSTVSPFFLDFILAKSHTVNYLGPQNSFNPESKNRSFTSASLDGGLLAVRGIGLSEYYLVDQCTNSLISSHISSRQVGSQDNGQATTFQQIHEALFGSSRHAKRLNRGCNHFRRSKSLDLSQSAGFLRQRDEDLSPPVLAAQITNGLDKERFSLHTRAAGRIKDRTGRQAENGIVSALSCDHAVIALSVTAGSMKFIAVKATLNNSDGSIEHFNARIDCLPIRTMQFLSNAELGQHLDASTEQSGSRKRTLCVIYEQVDLSSRICLYELSLREKFLKPSSAVVAKEDADGGSERAKVPRIATATWDISMNTSLSFDKTTTVVIPTLFGGTFFVGTKLITFYPKLTLEPTSEYMATDYQHFTGSDYLLKPLVLPDMKRMLSAAALRSDNDMRFVMCDNLGRLFLAWVTIQPKNRRNDDAYNIENYLNMNFELIGNVSPASKIVPLPNNHLFICSREADHQLVKMYRTLRHHGRHYASRCPFRALRVIQSFCNLTPIMDMVFVPTRPKRKQMNPLASGRNPRAINALDHWTLTTCCNLGQHGGVRFLRKSAILREKTILRGCGIQRAFYLPISNEGLLILAFPSATSVYRCKSPIFHSDPLQVAGAKPDSLRETLPQTSCKQEVATSSIDLYNSTLYAGRFDDVVIQVTTRRVTLLTIAPNGSLTASQEWEPFMENSLITHCSARLDLGLVIVVLGSRLIVKLEIRFCKNKKDGTSSPSALLKTSGQMRFNDDDLISCTDVVAQSSCSNNLLMACALSNRPFICLIFLDRMKRLASIDISTHLKSSVRTMCFVRLSSCLHLAIADGLNHCSVAPLDQLLLDGAMCDWHNIELASPASFLAEITLTNSAEKALLIGGQHSMFITDRNLDSLSFNDVDCDHLLSCSLYSTYHNNPNILLVKKLTVLHPSEQQEAKCISEISLGSFSDRSATHVNTLRLNETCRRIAYHASSDCLALLVWHYFPCFKSKLCEIKEYLDACASYRAFKGSGSFEDGVCQCEESLLSSGHPFAAQLMERRYNAYMPVVKRRRSEDSSDTRESEKTEADTASEGNERDNEETDTEKLAAECVRQEEHALVLVNWASGKNKTLPSLEYSHFLRPQEHGCSIATWTVNRSEVRSDVASSRTEEYLVIGTGLVDGHTEEPTEGRIILFSVRRSAGKPILCLLNEIKTDGAAFSMCQCNEYLVAAVNYKTHLYGLEWLKPRQPRIVLQSIHAGNCLNLFVKTLDNRCLVGDLVRSIEVLRVAPTETGNADALPSTQINEASSASEGVTLKILARDMYPNWITSVEIIEKNLFMMAEQSGNIIMCSSANESFFSRSTRPGGQRSVEQNRRGLLTEDPDGLATDIKEVSMVHSGHFINSIRKGSLVSGLHSGQIEKDYFEESLLKADFWDTVGMPVCQQVTEGSAASSTDLKSFLQWLLNGSRNGYGSCCYRKGLKDIRNHIVHSVLTSSRDGWIGQVMQISRAMYIFLWEIQRRLALSMENIGRIGHAEWRAFESELRTEACSGFIDGDLVEYVLSMTTEAVLASLKGMRIGSYVVEEIEDLEPIVSALWAIYDQHQ